MKVLITGASGLVGHGICEAAGAQEHELLLPSHAALDLRDAAAVRVYLVRERPDCVIHAAGVVGGIAANIEEPTRFLLANLDMGRNVIFGAYEAGVKTFINLGSSCMYPRDSDKPLAEEMVLKGELEPTNEGYALAKVVCARLCEYISREHPELRYKTLIPCNLYGRWDKFRTERAHMIPAVIHKLHMAKAQGLASVTVWGSGEARREFMYAGDLGDCVWYALAHIKEMPSMLNVGLGHDHTVNEYYRAVAKLVGYQGVFTHDLAKPEGMKRKLTDVARLQAFGWKAGTSLAEGLAKTYAFYLEHTEK